MEFIFGLAPDSKDGTCILVFVDEFSKMTYLDTVKAATAAVENAVHFVDTVFRHHGLHEKIVSDREPRFPLAFGMSLFELFGKKLHLATAAHPETDGKTDRVNQVLEHQLRSYATSVKS